MANGLMCFPCCAALLAAEFDGCGTARTTFSPKFFRSTLTAGSTLMHAKKHLTNLDYIRKAGGRSLVTALPSPTTASQTSPEDMSATPALTVAPGQSAPRMCCYTF